MLTDWTESNPKDYRNRRNLVKLLSQLSQHEAAKQVLDKLVEDEGLTRSNTLAQAQYAVDSRDFTAAQTIIQQYVQGLGEDATVDDWIVAARFLFMHKRYPGAMKLYKRAIMLEDAQYMQATRELARTLVMADMQQDALVYLTRLHEKNPTDRSITLLYSDTLLKLNRLNEAERLAAQLATDGQAADDKIYILRAQIAMAKSQINDAHSMLDSAEALNPQNARIHYLRARLYQNTAGQNAAALESVNRALDLAPTFTPAKLLRATVLVASGETEQATTQLQGVLRQDNDNVRVRRLLATLYQRQGDFDQARWLLTESAQMFPNQSVWQQRLGHLALAQNNNALAVEHFQKALEVQPSQVGLWDLTNALNHEKRYEQTLQVLRDHVEILQKYPSLNSKRGMALAGTDQLPKALRAFDLAIAASRNLNQLELVARDMGQTMGLEKAMAHIETSINPDNKVQTNLLLATYDTSTRDYASAIERLTSIDSDVPLNSPDRLRLDNMLARALHFAGDYDGAYSAYERVIERDPQAVVAMNNLAYMLSERLNRPEDALPHAERANELNPDSVEFLDTLGWIRYRLGQTNEAERVLRRSTEIQKRPANCIHLAIVLTERGDNQSIREAIKLAKTARDMARQGGNAPIVERAEKLLKEHDKGSRAQRP